MQAIEVRDREIELRLEGYARARLSPDPQSIARSRARIMREARLRFEEAQIAARTAPPAVLVPHRSMIRRVAMPLLAASVWVVLAVGTMSAAQPGGPLYPTRMWVETATLPANGMARATTELRRLDARLAEASTAAGRGDAGAVQAALDAYRQIADETLVATAGDAALETLVADALDKHRTVLTAVAASLSAKGNETAAAAVEASIQRAIAHNQTVIDRIDQGNSGGGNGSTGGDNNGGGNGGGNGAGSGAGSGGANPGGNDGANPGAGNPGAGGGTGDGGGPGASPVTDPGSGGGTGPGGNGGTGPGGNGGNSGGGNDKTPKPPKPTPTPPDPDHGNPDHTPRGQGQP